MCFYRETHGVLPGGPADNDYSHHFELHHHSLGADLYIRFIVGALLIVVGLTVFLLGVDIGITQIGNLMGASIAKTNRLLIVIAAGLILGFVISVAEPDLHILAQQVENVTAGSIGKAGIVLVVSAGIALMLALGFIRILYNLAVNKIFTVLYLIVFLLAYFTPNEFMAISLMPQARYNGSCYCSLHSRSGSGGLCAKKRQQVF